jgi:tetratricopeptide (TPR) repeat protein
MFCLLRGSEVARSGKSQKAIALVQEAQRQLTQSPLRSDIAELREWMSTESYRNAGRYSDAIPAFEQASMRLTALGRDDTQTAGTLFNNWALALNQLGRPLDAEKIYRRGIDISRADDTEQAVSPMLMINYARVLRDLARVDEAADYAQRGYDKAQQAGDQVVSSEVRAARVDLHGSRRRSARDSDVVRS